MNFVERLELRKDGGFFVEVVFPDVILKLGFRNSWSSYFDLNKKKKKKDFKIFEELTHQETKIRLCLLVE